MSGGAGLRDAFLGWQCRCRQLMMREGGGRPTAAVTPAVTLPGAAAPLGHVITVLSKRAEHAATPELAHIAAKSRDPARWREEGLKYLSATHYQKPREFSDILTATFRPGSSGAARLRAAGACRLDFDAYGERYSLHCTVAKLSRRNPLHAATFAHNRLFNPALSPEAEILGFAPDWESSARG